MESMGAEQVDRGAGRSACWCWPRRAGTARWRRRCWSRPDCRRFLPGLARLPDGSWRRAPAPAVLAQEALAPDFSAGWASGWPSSRPGRISPGAFSPSARHRPSRTGRRWRSDRDLGNFTALERPVHPATLVSAVRSALRGRRRQYHSRDVLRRARTGGAPARSVPGHAGARAAQSAGGHAERQGAGRTGRGFHARARAPAGESSAGRSNTCTSWSTICWMSPG